MGGALRRYLAGLFALAHDPSGEVRKPVCTGLVQLLHLQPERLAAHMRDIIEYMLESTQVPARTPNLSSPHLAVRPVAGVHALYGAVQARRAAAAYDPL